MEEVEESRRRLAETQEWIEAYDVPVERIAVADMFNDLKSEIEYWKEMYVNLLKE